MVKKFTTNLPDGKWSDKFIGVYRVNFDNGKFYIGSSWHLRQRASSWKSFLEMRRPDFHVGKNVRDILHEINEAYFEVIEYVSDISKLRDIETAYLMGNIDNPLFINCAYVTRKGVIKYSYAFEEIQRYPSIKDAARQNNCKLSRIQRVLSGEKKSYGGYIYRYDDEAMNVQSKRDKEIYEGKEELRLSIVKELANGLEIIEVSKKLGIYIRTVQGIILSFRNKYKARTTYQLMAILGRSGIV